MQRNLTDLDFRTGRSGEARSRLRRYFMALVGERSYSMSYVTFGVLDTRYGYAVRTT